MRRLLPCLAVLLLTACSSAELAYRNADWLILSYADDLVDLRDAQEKAWEPLVEAAMARHRERELPNLVALMGGAEDGVRHGFTRPRLECLRDQGRAAVARNAEMLAAIAAPLLVDLEPQQLAHLRERLAERDADYVDDHLSPDPAARHDARVARFVKRIERWTGRLGGQQRSLVARRVAAWPELAQGWADYRRERQERMFALLESGADAVTLEAFLAGWWGHQAAMPPTLREARREVETRVVDLLLELHGTLGSEQEQHLAEELGDLRRGLAVLVPEAAVAAAARDVGCASAVDASAPA